MFADGLRYDVAGMLAERLEAKGYRVRLSHRLAPLPTVTSTAKPFATLSHDKLEGGEESVRTTLYTCCEALRITAILLSPFMPETAEEILRRVGQPDELENARLPESIAWGGSRVGTETHKGQPLFPRIDLEALAEESG